MAETTPQSSCPETENQKTQGYQSKPKTSRGKETGQKERISKEDCDLPETHIVKGANQYGHWQRCLKCQSKISYTPHERRQTKKEKGTTVIYIKEEKVEVLEDEKGKRSKVKESGAASSTDVKALQETLVESNQQLLTGMTIVQGQQALMEMSQQSMMGQGAMLQSMQSNQAELTQAVIRLAQSKESTEEWDRVEEPRDPHGR